MVRTVSSAAAFLILLIGLATAGHAGDDGLLKGLSGQWRGTGAVRTAGDAPQEKLVCRVDGELDGSGNELELNGRCGGERFTGTFTISLSYNSQSGRYSAIWRDSLGSRSPPLTGLRAGGRLVFKIRHNDFENDGRAVSTLIVDPQTSRFRVVGRTEPATGSGDFVSADLVFVRG